MDWRRQRNVSVGTVRIRSEIRIGHHTYHCCLKHFALLFLSRIFVFNRALSFFFPPRKRKYLYSRNENLTDLYLNKESFSYIRSVQFLEQYCWHKDISVSACVCVCVVSGLYFRRLQAFGLACVITDMLIANCCMWSLAYLRVSAVVHPHGWYGSLRDVHIQTAVSTCASLCTDRRWPGKHAFLELTNFTKTVLVRGKRFLILKVPRRTLRSIRPPIQRISGTLSLKVKRPEREARPSPPPSYSEVKNSWSRISTSLYVSVTCCLIKHRDNFISAFYQLYEVRSQILFWLSNNS